MEYLEGAVYLVIAQLFVCAIINLKSKIQSNRILGFFLLLIVDNIRKSFIPLHVDNIYFTIFTYNLHTDMLYGPIMYLYLHSKSHDIKRIGFAKHLALPLLYNLVLVFSMLFYRFVLDNEAEKGSYINLMVSETRIIVFGIYFFLSWRLVKSKSWQVLKYSKRFNMFFVFLATYCSVYYINILLIKYAYGFIGQAQPFYSYITYGIFISFVIFLVLYSVTEVNGLKSFFLNLQIHSPDQQQASFKKIDKRFDYLFEEEKVHLNDDLSLSMLAGKLGVSNTELSDYLQQVLEVNFYDHINKYRVEEFKMKLSDPKFNHLDMLGIAFESGFQSKATFNRAFKKIEGITPSEYKKQVSKTNNQSMGFRAPILK